MTVCLIRPPIVLPKWNQAALFTPPIGLAYVAASVRDAGHSVHVIDALGEGIDVVEAGERDCFLYGLPLQEVVERIPDAATVIGVSSAFSFEWPANRALISLIRRRFPSALLIAGGEHITAMPEASLAASELDAAVLGEGEETTLAIVEASKNGADLSAIPGVAFKNGDSIVVNPRRNRIRDLDSIPWPAWDLLPIDAYLDRNLGFGVDRGRAIPVLASRGCPYQCTFCSSPNMWTTRWVVRSVAGLLDELAFYQDRYAVTNFDFYDLTAIVKKRWIVEFCEEILRRRMTFTWQLPSGTRSEAIDSEVASLLYRSGCRNLSYAPESGSPNTLKRIKKKIDPERMLQSIRASSAAKINIKFNIMIGFPGETHRDVLTTYRFIARMALAGAHDLSIWAFSPYPGSALFDELRERGGLKFDDDYYDSLRSYADASRTISYSENISDRALKMLRLIGLMIFYCVAWSRRPLRVVRMATNLITERPESRSEMAIMGILRRRRIGKARVTNMSGSKST